MRGPCDLVALQIEWWDDAHDQSLELWTINLPYSINHAFQVLVKCIHYLLRRKSSVSGKPMSNCMFCILVNPAQDGRIRRMDGICWNLCEMEMCNETPDCVWRTCNSSHSRNDNKPLCKKYTKRIQISDEWWMEIISYKISNEDVLKINPLWPERGFALSWCLSLKAKLFSVTDV